MKKYIHKYEGNVKTNFFWIVPPLIGVSKNNVNNNSDSNIYALHITPFIEIGFGWLGTRNGYSKR